MLLVWVWLGAESGWALFGLDAQSQRRSAACAGNTVPPVKGEQNGATCAGLSGCNISCGVIN